METNGARPGLTERARDDFRQGPGIPSPHALGPARALLAVGLSGAASVPGPLISPDTVGCKAFGLSSLPPEWVPTFFVVDAASLDASGSGELLQAGISQCLLQLDMQHASVFVRSSGTAETIRNRGRLVSARCSAEDIVPTIRRLSASLSGQKLGTVHWIVQQYVRPVRKGHLSNERHLSYENRDWVAETEIQDDRVGYTSPVAVRPWRDGSELADLDLSCTSEPQITLRLKRVAIWATRVASRIHFEWVWDGATVWIVQADTAEFADGIDPTSLRPDRVPRIAPKSLAVFQIAKPEQYDHYQKLRNAKLYQELGYRMPRFYVLDDAHTINSLLQGRVPPELEHDLAELTKRPLIIRTDGTGIPTGKREMLPRSDEVRTLDEAKEWLLSVFRVSIEKSGLQSAVLSLIAHHFIPSTASAWARAVPGIRIVRIESLWGLPEGLYWYSHDTFEVDVGQGTAITPRPKYPFWERLRYKGTFVAPDPVGRWVPCRTAAPYDWRRSVSRRAWIFEIAATTRRVADCEKHPVAVMWFIGNDPRVTRHRVLPWFHNRSELGELPKAAPRRKLTTARDHRIRTRTDWEDLRHQVLAGGRVERVVVEPVEPELVRDPEFAEQLADFAARNNIVVELAGGILSHAYYILQRGSAQVECVDLFGAEEEVIEYNKLVRDRIPAIIEGRGERVAVIQLRGDALLAALRRKLVEEAFEALDAKAGDELIGELADVQEVVNAVIGALQVGKTRIKLERTDKRKRRGGFDHGFMLRKTSTPHSLSGSPDAAQEPMLSIKPAAASEPLIVQRTEIPSSRAYQRPDLRNVDQQPEKLFAFEIELDRMGNARHATNFTMPMGGDVSREFTLTIELSRRGSSLRGNVRLRLGPSQMVIKLSDSQPKLGFPE